MKHALQAAQQNLPTDAFSSSVTSRTHNTMRSIMHDIINAFPMTELSEAWKKLQDDKRLRLIICIWNLHSRREKWLFEQNFNYISGDRTGTRSEPILCPFESHNAHPQGGIFPPNLWNKISQTCVNEVTKWDRKWQEAITRQPLYVYRNTEAHSHNHCRRVKAISITYSECVL
jgi:hypothetical protein